MGQPRLRQVMQDMKSNVARQVAVLPTHQDFLRTYCPADV
jgi:tryptophan halogenase